MHLFKENTAREPKHCTLARSYTVSYYTLLSMSMVTEEIVLLVFVAPMPCTWTVLHLCIETVV